jgi:hypothetical protein
MSSLLPVVPRETLDTSVLQTWQRCPRKAYLQYWLNRSPGGKNYSIGFGIMYHTFREELEKMWQAAKTDDIQLAAQFCQAAIEIASDGWEDPPVENNKSFLTKQRFIQAALQGFDAWVAEKRNKVFTVLEVEQGFQLPLPSGRIFGGRFDQILEWNGQLWVRDFKTTSRMGKSYPKMFDPNDQMTCYTWAASQLSGRKVQGVIIQVIYNTKNIGPEHHQFISTRSPAHIEEWQANVEREATIIDQHTEEGYFPMRTTGCNDFNGCYYRDCCALSSWKMRDKWLESHTVESHWDFMNPDAEEGIVD